MCTLLAPMASRIVVAPLQTQRTASPTELGAACTAANPAAPVEVAESLAAAWARVAGEEFVVLTGSLYLVGEAMDILALDAGSPAERGLNEWAQQPMSPAKGERSTVD